MCVGKSMDWDDERNESWSLRRMRASNSSTSAFRIITATAVPLAAAIAVEVTAATVVMNKSNRDMSSRDAAAVRDNSSMIAKDKSIRNR